MDDSPEPPRTRDAVVGPVEPEAPAPARRPGPGLPAAVGWLVVLLVVQFVVGLGVYFACGVAALFVAVADKKEPVVFLPDNPTVLATATTTTLVVALLAACYRYGRGAWRYLAVRRPAPRHLLLTLLLPVPLIVAVGEFTAYAADAARAAGVPEHLIDLTHLLAELDDFGKYPAWWAAVVVAVFISLFPGVGEELFFRGFLGRGLVARWGRWGGVGLTALLFGVMHIHPLHAVVAAVIGVVLHAVYLWTRSLVVPVLLHATYNGLGTLGNVLLRGSRYDVAADAHAPLPLALTACAAVAGTLWLISRSRVRWVAADGTEWTPGFATAEAPPASAGARPVAGPMGGAAVALVTAAYLAFAAAAAAELAH